MKIGVYGDVHLTKNLRGLQDIWEVTATKSICSMYDKFDELNVEAVVCLGDFFDAPRIEARSMNLVMPILDTINSRTYPTYFLLGNHEADSSESNILEILSTYENIIPVTGTTQVEWMLFIPYYDSPEYYDMTSAKVVFTHHDIYGSDLASGQTKAFFGLPTSTFKDAKLVMNGHVHLKSQVAPNIINAGSILVSSQGELRVGEYPSYYTLDTNSGELTTYDNEHSMIFLTIDEHHAKDVRKYESSHLVLRVEYENEIPRVFINAAHTSWRKKITNIEEKEELMVRTSNFDMKNYLIDYLKKEEEIPNEYKEDYINTGLEMLQ